MNDFVHGNRIDLLRAGPEYFPALEAACDAASREIYLETYIFADDATGQRIAAALLRAAQRGVTVRLMVDGLVRRHRKITSPFQGWAPSRPLKPWSTNA